jgi:3-hydroxyacyl-CoA dehydrogenase
MRAVEVTTSKDVPGFVSNALLMPFINEVHLPTRPEAFRLPHP